MSYNKPLDFNELFINNTEMICNNCKDFTLHSEKIIYNFLNNDYLLARLNNFIYINKRLVKLSNKIVNYDINNLIIPNIQNFSFKVISAITYTGTSYEGHYVIWVRSGSGWRKISDTVGTYYPNFIKNLKNVYLLILKKN